MPRNTLHLWFLGNPTAPALVGTLNFVSARKSVSLTYSEYWLAQGFALSEDLPLLGGERIPNLPEMAAGAVDDARPDRWGERVIRFLDRPPRLSLMEYLYFAGDERFGALGVSTSAAVYLPRVNGPLPSFEQAQTISGIVAKIIDRQPLDDLERRLMAAGGSFGGTKPKALIEIDGEQWVLKFFAGEPVDTPLIEHAAMTMAAKAGIRVATTRLIAMPGQNALAIKRFDRTGSRRVHAISAGTALRALRAGAATDADLGYPNLAQFLRRRGDTAADSNGEQTRELFRRMVFNILIDNTDDHEKNHVLLAAGDPAGGIMELSPAFDVLPTGSGQGMQEFTVGKLGRDSTLVNAMSQCELFALTRPAAAAQVLQVIDVVNDWREHFAACGVTAADIDSLAQQIDGPALLAQRRGFSATEFMPGKTPAKPGGKRRSAE